MKEVVKLLEKENVLEYDDGRQIMWAPNHKIPLTVVKSDGGYTYDTSDMAALKQRIEEEKANRVVYVTDLGQAPHFELVFAASRRINWLKDNEVFILSVFM